MATDARVVPGAEARRTAQRPQSRICLDGQALTANGYDNAIRWEPGERLEDLFEAQVDTLTADAVAVDGPSATLTYRELDSRANRLARYLQSQGRVVAGSRVALLFDDPVQAYVAMLAVLKVHAAYVPLDPGFPPNRLAFIVGDANVILVLSSSHLREELSEIAADVAVVHPDELAAAIEACPDTRLTDDELGQTDDSLAYLIYTSGTTGRPKGVAIHHPSICNFVRVADEVYGMRAEDRVYQGLTIAFDFAVEEIWVAWMAGATLVPKPAGGQPAGP